MADTKLENPLTRKDFVAPIDVRWCPGCGDYSILNSIQSTLPKLGIPREKFVFISGIGCSSRFPYYMNTYGFHTIHGRAPTIATGVKVANPDLSVWVITGDGDGLSIGGNHLLHLCRKNVDVNVLLFNNRIYGLTKGQYSPTSQLGKVTKTSPMGSIETPINPLCFALAAEATFVARTIDTNPKHMTAVFEEAAKHKGISFVEIMQNCVIFNDKTWAPIAGREVRDEQLVMLEHGKPLLFGKDKKKGLIWKGLKLEVVTIGENEITEDDIIVHNAHIEDPSYAYKLSQMSYPELPTPMGVFRNVEGRLTYDEAIIDQINEATLAKGKRNLQEIINGPDYWEVSESGEAQVISDEAAEEEGVQDELTIMEEQSKKSEEVEQDPLLSALKTRIYKMYDNYKYDRNVIMKPTDSLAIAVSHFKVHKVRCILIIDNGKLVGVLTERDIIMRAALKGIDRETTPISTIMTKNPDKVTDVMSVGNAINHLSIGGFRHLPIERRNGEYGVMSVRHVLEFLYDTVHKK